jgi:hypothetical protein
MQPDRPRKPLRRDSEFLDSLRLGMGIGVVLLLLIAPFSWVVQYVREHGHHQQVAAAPEAVPGAPFAPPTAAVPQAPQPSQEPQRIVPAVRLADFHGEDPSPDARLLANWVLTTRNNGARSFILVDKKDARVYVFSPQGALQDSAPALLGAARGDDSYPGIGDKPLSQVRPEEKTTPAGRFVAELGQNAGGEDVVWVDYDAAVSMHRVRPLVARERRLERLATLTTDDNRISFGCINLPVRFYEDVVHPAVTKYGAVIYVLPDVKTVRQVFGAFDVTDPIQLAAFQQAVAAPATAQQVALQQR